MSLVNLREDDKLYKGLLEDDKLSTKDSKKMTNTLQRTQQLNMYCVLVE